VARDVGLIQLELERLRSIRAGGVRSVQEGDNRLEHRSDAELVRAIRALEDELAQASGATTVRSVVVRATANKGW
jgi:hypothetical protein